MGRNTRITPFGEQNGDGFDEEASVSKFMSYRSTPSNSNGSFPPEESMPLFLSDYDDEEPQPPSFGRGRDRATVSPRIIFRASLLAAAAAGILLVVLSVENPMALFANAKASLVGTSAGQFGAAAPPVRPAPETVLASAEPSAPLDVQSNVSARALPQTAKSAPTRDEIAAAFRTARQVPPDVRAPQAVAPAPVPAPAVPAAPVVVAAAPAAAPVVAAPQVRRLDPDELAWSGRRTPKRPVLPCCWLKPTIRACSGRKICEASLPIQQRRVNGTRRQPGTVHRTRSSALAKCRISFHQRGLL